LNYEILESWVLKSEVKSWLLISAQEL